MLGRFDSKTKKKTRERNPELPALSRNLPGNQNAERSKCENVKQAVNDGRVANNAGTGHLQRCNRKCRGVAYQQPPVILAAA